MTVAMAIIAVGVVMLLAGGPRNFIEACERGLETVAESVYQGWRSFKG